MTAQVIDGRKIAASLKIEVARELEALRADNLSCGLATIAVGAEYSSVAYQRRLRRIADELGMPYREYTFPEDASERAVLDAVDDLNADRDTSGILVLRPLPPHLSETAVFRALSPVKDIEAVHPENAGLLASGTPRYVPSTAASAFHVLDTWLEDSGEDKADFYHRSLIVVVGRSNNVGKPAISLAFDRQAAVESIDEWASTSGRLGWHTRRADVLIVAAGVAGLIRAAHIRAGAVILDVGINAVRATGTGKVHMVGDVNLPEVLPRARAVTPVPGGIGPVTDVWLLRNTISAARNLSAREEQVA